MGLSGPQRSDIYEEEKMINPVKMGIHAAVIAFLLASSGAHADGKPVTCNLCDLRYQSFTGKILNGSNFEGAYLFNTDWQRASLIGVNFSSANLVLSKFNRADLTKAIFTKADLTRAAFYGATLRGANHRFAKFAEANLDAAE